MRNTFKKIVVSILTFEAKAALRRHNPKIIAVTGNVGKTSTKDAIYAVVSEAKQGTPHSVRKSQKSQNSEIGLPLTILGLENAWSSPKGWARNIWSGLCVASGFDFGFRAEKFPKWLVLEIGADHPGDIESVSKWLHPDIVVLTRMSDVPVHVEFFKDAGDVLREKMFLARGMKADGTLIVNADDPHFVEAVKGIAASKIFYGATKGSAVEISESEIMYDMEPLPLPVGQYVVLKIGDDTAVETKIELAGAIGEHIMYPVAAACAVAKAIGIESSIKPAFRDFESPKGRMHILKGVNSSAIIDDTYNSSPLACSEALNTMSRLSLKGKKIAALADMKELGENSDAAHLAIGRQAADILHTLVTVGDMSKATAQAALAAGMAADRVYMFDTAEEAGAAIKEMIRAGDVVLAKGSQSMRMERAVKVLLAPDQDPAQILVRQEAEWLRR